MAVEAVWTVDLGLPRAVSGVLKPRLSTEAVGRVGEEARGVGGRPTFQIQETFSIHSH
ncbi:hypothetical protein QJS10_CPA05g01597 [Acorus calamus]|uniref:Uncharacterized protein n=1 Tax=Acorus calamus TaxID=4465 RepID=A0AAV9EUI6_ACOCL|nr:hypothetical protein QJS10_CPA05g01597 [Acorus calamus]